MKRGVVLQLISNTPFRNTPSASPASLRYVMEWNPFLSQVMTCPPAGATGRSLRGRSFRQLRVTLLCVPAPSLRANRIDTEL